MSSQPHYFFGRLEVRILSAKDLRSVALIGKMSPYAKVTLNANAHETGVCHHGDRTPAWTDGAAVWRVKCSPRDEFSIQLKHKSGLHSGSIGRWITDFKQIMQLGGTNTPKWVQLLTEDNFKPAGMVEVELRWMPDDSAQNSLTAPIAAVPSVQPPATPTAMAGNYFSPSPPPAAGAAAGMSRNGSLPAPLQCSSSTLWTNPPAANPAASSPPTPSSLTPTPSAASAYFPPPSNAAAYSLSCGGVATWDCDECTYAGNKEDRAICEVCGATKKAIRIAREAELKAAEAAARLTCAAPASALPVPVLNELKAQAEDGAALRANGCDAVNECAEGVMPVTVETVKVSDATVSAAFSIPSAVTAPAAIMSPPPAYAPPTPAHSSLAAAAGASVAPLPVSAVGDAAAQYYQPPASMYPPAQPYPYAPPAAPYSYYSTPPPPAQPQPQPQPGGYAQYYAPQQMQAAPPVAGYPQQYYGYQPNPYAYNQFNY